ncbi:MAG: DoxX family protein, partial [Chitinophagaceae bacterium]
MKKKNLLAGKTKKIIYWIATTWLALGMLSTGIVQLLKTKEETDLIIRLGYPMYFLTMLGICKILGVITVLIPKFPLLKEWAYAGFFFAMSGAVFSHIALGNSVNEIFPPLLLLFLTVASWYFRPAGRKIIPVNAGTSNQETSKMIPKLDVYLSKAK